MGWMFMEGNMLYHQYLKPNSEYYGKLEMIKKNSKYNVSKIPDTYAVISERDSVWKHYQVKVLILSEQGWKIHITATLEDSQSVLDKVAQLCIDEKTVFKHLNDSNSFLDMNAQLFIDYKNGFKHLKDRNSYLEMNSKSANRASSGKFITIYHINNENFVEMLELISLTIQDFKKGPYILSDKRWKKSNVFY